MYILRRTSGSGRTKWINSIYFEPDSKTLASAVLLNDYLHGLDEDYLKSYGGRMERIQFSRDTLTRWKNQLGKLFCVYCNKKDLQIEYDGMTLKSDVMATLEHLNPISKGGGVFDLSHIVCACGTCNRNRSNKDLDAHLNARGIEKPEFDANCQVYFKLDK